MWFAMGCNTFGWVSMNPTRLSTKPSRPSYSTKSNSC
ncbi:hypothetical protein SLEP1_g33321 [Rubroshorea leprosula]|uniref:Uncharacterized protein n=1 Tax=Rubroshorea leprosula TaxID=152421 RepID=A0AAV5KG76_9ROSI|nr:hypothetical protein SLEP1_g33321 [Rubroshorea leprosula]